MLDTRTQIYNSKFYQRIMPHFYKIIISYTKHIPTNNRYAQFKKIYTYIYNVCKYIFIIPF